MIRCFCLINDFVLLLCADLLVNMRLKKWLAAANTTLCAGKCFP